MLTAVGFGTDQMFLVPRIRYYGCPRFPFYVIRTLDYVGAGQIVARHMPDDRHTDFEWVAVERDFPGTEIKTGDRDGWAWFELDRVDPSAGASRAELDALRLMAMFLSHWDNKASNQRLVCLPSADDPAGGCAHPFAIVQDLGATFGPLKMALDHWEATPIWADAPRCLVSMKRFPYDGGTFADVQISEAGRALIARQLTSLRDDQITALFVGARFFSYFGGAGRDADTRAWVQAFRNKGPPNRDRRPVPVLRLVRPAHLA